jgi:hypothetical protein
LRIEFEECLGSDVHRMVMYRHQGAQQRWGDTELTIILNIIITVTLASS